MDDPIIKIVYDGGDAERHIIDARYFGQSLQGIDHLVSDALIVFSTGRLPRRKERAPLVLKVGEPRRGSVEVIGGIQELSSMLPMGFIPVVGVLGDHVIGHYVGATLDYFTGRDRAAEAMIRQLAEMHVEAVKQLGEDREFLDRVDQRRHTEVMGMQSILRESIAANREAAKNYAAPIGRSVDTASFHSGDKPTAVLGPPDAELIRSSSELTWTPVEEMVLTTDGYRFHDRVLSVENPDRDGFLMADVDDPAFDREGNAYTMAAQRKAKIKVLARKGFRGEKLLKIQIVDFISEV